MPVREWRRMATTAGGILLAACVTVAGMSAWESHESATAAREREQATADCAAVRAAAKKAERKLAEYLDGDRLAQAKAVTADKLADPETLETLNDLSERYAAGERIPTCAGGTETAQATTSTLRSAEKRNAKRLARVRKAVGRCSPHGWPIRSNRANDCIPPPKARCRTNILAPAARLNRQARREGHHRRHGQGERLHRREPQGRRGKEGAGGGRSGCGAGAGAEHAAPQQYSYMPSGSASGSGSGSAGGRRSGSCAGSMATAVPAATMGPISHGSVPKVFIGSGRGAGGGSGGPARWRPCRRRRRPAVRAAAAVP